MSKRILVVEDQPDSRQIIRDMLAGTDYEIAEAENGEEALTAIEKQRDPYRAFALRHRCDAAWAACSYPRSFTQSPRRARPHPHPPPSRCAISTMVLR
jgi:CheY-like chemotaxis protein